VKKTVTRTILASLAIIGTLSLTGCQQYFARNFGGTMTLNLPQGEQLVSMTWKQTSLWVLTYNPTTKTCHFREDSGGGVLEGEVKIPNCTPALMVGQVPPAK
jgi:hypothetical protein